MTRDRSTMATVPVPPPDPIAAYRREMAAAAAHAATAEALYRGMSDAQRLQVLHDARRAAGVCVDCGHTRLEGDERCFVHSLAHMQRTG